MEPLEAQGDTGLHARRETTVCTQPGENLCTTSWVNRGAVLVANRGGKIQAKVVWDIVCRLQLSQKHANWVSIGWVDGRHQAGDGPDNNPFSRYYEWLEERYRFFDDHEVVAARNKKSRSARNRNRGVSRKARAVRAGQRQIERRKRSLRETGREI